MNIHNLAWTVFLSILSIVGTMTHLQASDPIMGRNLSHAQRDESFQISLQKLIDKVKARGDLPYISVEGQLELIDSLAQFDLGQFLIERGGVNGLWIHYAITHPLKGRLTGLNNRGDVFSELEAFILDRAPITLPHSSDLLFLKGKFKRESLKSAPSLPFHQD